MDRRTLYNQFLQQFPIENLEAMTLEEYTNLDKDNSFCYWLESKTYDLAIIAERRSRNLSCTRIKW